MKKQTTFYVLIGLLTCLFIGLFAYTVNPKLDLNGDNVAYIRLAHALADNQGYSNVSADGSSSPASHFPPGYSAILSVLIRVGLDSLMAFKVLNGLFLLLSVIGLFVITRWLTNQIYLSFAIAVLTMFSPSLLSFAGMTMSEMSYMAATVLSMWMLYIYSHKSEGQAAPSRSQAAPSHSQSTPNRSRNQSDGKTKAAAHSAAPSAAHSAAPSAAAQPKDQAQIKPTPYYRSPYFYLSILFAACAYYIRTVGASILLAVVVFYLFRKEWWASLSAAAGCVLCLLPWSLRNAAHGIEGRYLGTIMTVNPWRPEEGTISSVGEMIDKMWVNLNDTTIQGFKGLLFPFGEWPTTGFVAYFFGFLVLMVVLYGVWNMGKMRWAMAAFLLGNMGLFALWHGGNGTRYVTPLIPFLFVFFYVGVWATVQQFVLKRRPFDGKPNSLWGLVFLLMMLPMIKPLQPMHAEAKRPYPLAYSHYFNLAQMMQNSMEKGTVVCCRKPEFFVHFAPNMVCTNYTYDLNPDVVIRDMVKSKVDYVVVERLGYGSTARYLYPAIQAHPDLFTKVYVSPAPETTLLKFNREAARQKLSPVHAD